MSLFVIFSARMAKKLRSFKGLAFSKKCGCDIHDECDDCQPLLLVSANSGRASVKQLKLAGILDSTKKYVCKKCMQFGEELCLLKTKTNTRPPATSLIHDDVPMDVDDGDDENETVDEDEVESINVIGDIDSDLDEIGTVDDTSEIDDGDEIMDATVADTVDSNDRELDDTIDDAVWEDMSEEEKQNQIQIARKLGKIIYNTIFKDTLTILADYKTSEQSQQDWLMERNGLLMGFLEGCTGVQADHENGKKVNVLTSAVECILHTRNLNLVSPFAFRRNFIQLGLTENKTVTQINGAWGPGGSYTTVHSYLMEPAEEVNCPEGLVDYVIDNNQTISKTSGQIREASRLPVNICTCADFIKPDQTVTSYQDIHIRDDLKPGSWLQKPNTEIMSKVDKEEENAMETFRSYRFDFVTEKITDVKKEQVQADGQISDYVDTAIVNKAIHKDKNNVCSNCFKVYVKCEDICSYCGHNSRVHLPDHDPYYHVKVHHHPPTPPSVIIGEPCMANPSSESAVKEVLTHMKQQCDIPRSRSWMTMWSDGVPHVIASQLQDRIYICLECGDIMDTKCELNLNIIICDLITFFHCE